MASTHFGKTLYLWSISMGTLTLDTDPFFPDIPYWSACNHCRMYFFYTQWDAFWFLLILLTMGYSNTSSVFCLQLDIHYHSTIQVSIYVCKKRLHCIPLFHCLVLLMILRLAWKTHSCYFVLKCRCSIQKALWRWGWKCSLSGIYYIWL